MMQTGMLARAIPRLASVIKHQGPGLVTKRRLATSNARLGAGCGGSKKPLNYDSKPPKATNQCLLDCPQPKIRKPCMAKPCPPPVANCPLNDPCWHCPYTPPPCPKQVHRCCPRPPCVENPKEFKSVCCEKANDPCNIKCDTCEKKPECCPCDPCQSGKKKNCCPADLQQKYLCNRPTPKRVLKRCERPGSCSDPCCPRTPCCPDPCNKLKNPCEPECKMICPRPEIPDVCSELGIICGPDKECEFKHPEPCPKPCERRNKHLKKKRQPQEPPCCTDLDPEWPPKRPHCDAECLSPDPCNPCQQKCGEKREFWDGL